MNTSNTIKMPKLVVPVPFKLPYNKVHLFLCGTGGNGAHFAHNALRILYDHTEKGIREYKVTMADGDLVETKNISRQNFYPSDIGKNKAVVTGSRYGRTFGLEVANIPHFIENKDDLKEVLFIPDYFPILVTCFDNHKSRKMVNELFTELPGQFIWLDLGNSEYVGQVVCGFNAPNKLKETDKKPSLFKLPSVIECFPEIMNKDDLFKSEESCDDHAVTNIQNIGANIFCSTIAFLMFNQLLSEEGLSTYMVKFNAKSQDTETFKTTYDNLKQY